MNRRALLCTSLASLIWAGTAVPASADIVVLSSKRTLSVKSHRIDGDSIILTLRSGGEVTCDKSLIEKILPDEVPYPEPQPEPAQQVQMADAVPAMDPGLLEQTPYGEIISAMSE